VVKKIQSVLEDLRAGRELSEQRVTNIVLVASKFDAEGQAT
jgi:hypothetical protein